MALALVQDLRGRRAPMSADEVADLEVEVLAGFVMARASAGVSDSTIRNDSNHLELIRAWFERPLWEMEPTDADRYFGRQLRAAAPATRTGRAAARARLRRTHRPAPSRKTAALFRADLYRPADVQAAQARVAASACGIWPDEMPRPRTC